MKPLIHAPELHHPDTHWLNTPQPWSLADLRGRLVILDFWTSCCINCIHVLATLKQVEQRFAQRVAVIGVHSPKFDAEKNAEHVAHAIARLDIAHPVIHDPDMRLWRRYAVRAWPTLVFIDPSGRLLGQASGEPDPQALLDYIAAALERQGPTDLPPFPFSPPSAPEERFSFPAAVKPFPCGHQRPRWLVADSGHHQLALIASDGAEVARFGSGRAGLVDGPASDACFCRPQGFVADCQQVWVADTGNHALRHLDLVTGMVTTLAGDGRRGAGGPRPQLASPWDLELLERTLYIANAGTHQILSWDLDRPGLRLAAGSGREGLLDGPALEAELAQPSGLARDRAGQRLFFADCETSAIRVLHRGPSPHVETLAGTGLFDFGHVNGPLAQAQLQHPQALALWDDTRLVVADTFNHRLRLLDLQARTLSDAPWPLACWGGNVCRPLTGPAGVGVDDQGRMAVANTDQHQILLG
ncbi:MAG: redoxin domain-containing protein [Magnetococcus sp. WYHC-3]